MALKAFQGSKLGQRAGSRKRDGLRVICSAQPQTSRRELLTAGAAVLAAAPLLVPKGASAVSTEAQVIDVNNLSTFQRQDQRTDYLVKAQIALSEVLTSADAPACVRLAFNDAGTWDEATKTGGMDGSIVLSSELDRPENAMLKPLVEKLKTAKAVIDERGSRTGAGPISWSDLLVLAGKVSTEKAWREVKVVKLSDPNSLGLVPNAPWPVTLGRVDRAEAAPEGRIPAAGAAVDEIKAYLLKLGAKPQSGPLSAKPPFWERPGFVIWTAAALDPVAEEERFAAADPLYAQFKKKYDSSRKTLTRTDYEVDFVNYYNKLTTLGVKINPDAYLFPIKLASVRL